MHNILYHFLKSTDKNKNQLRTSLLKDFIVLADSLNTSTTEPPVLIPLHPIRRLFSRHGSIVARHPVRWILISVVFAVVLCYPIIFLYSHSYTTSISNLPHHVWTSARALGPLERVTPDVDVRQAWVHGSYMRALEPEVLSEALYIQQALFGPTLDCEYHQWADAFVKSKGKPPPTRPDEQPISPVDDFKTDIISFFHSALMYWNCSLSTIEGDTDLIETVNARSNCMTAVNLTLRHSSVFAGKTFSRDRLIAADALVISFFYVDARLGEHWEARADKLAKQADRRWSIYPSDGVVKSSQLYEFRFEPMSVKEDVLLGVAYVLMGLYVAVSLRRLRVVKSQLGLAATVVTQIGISIISSFTICVIFKVDLSRIPREAYPFVVLAIGIENIFRLINAVLLVPPEASTVSRISHALGDIGHLSLAGAFQNLVVLWLLSKSVSGGVAAFCTFSAVALVLDYFFHLTFFLAVLSVDVQRMELQDCLDRVNMVERTVKQPDHGKQRLSGAFNRGKLPFSTRIAGTALMVCFVSILNWHFFDNRNPFELMLPMQLLFREKDPKPAPPKILAVPINQARSPTSWLRLQDHDTTKEVIQIVKPYAHSIIVRVYDPLIFVLNGANRDQPDNLSNKFPFTLLPAPSDTIREHIQPFILFIVLVVAAVALLMNYLLWDELSDGVSDLANCLEPRLSTKTYNGGHILDVAMVCASLNGTLVSVGLDRRVVLWNLTTGWSCNLSEDVRLMKSDMSFWPVVAVAVENRGRWLAICSGSGLITIWNFQDQSIRRFAHLDLGERQLPVFAFTPDREMLTSKLIFMKADGWLGELDPSTFEASNHKVVNGKIISAESAFTPKKQLKILIATKDAHVCIITRTGDGWVSEKCKLFEDFRLAEHSTPDITTILPIPALGTLMVVGRSEARLLDLQTLSLVHIFKTKQIKAHSFRVVHSARRQCSICGIGFGVYSFSIVYSECETQTLIIHTFAPDSKQKNLICFSPPKGTGNACCKGFENATETVHNKRGAGVWEATAVNTVIGVRKKVASPRRRDHTPLHSYPPGRVRRRGVRQDTPKSAEEECEWEVWMMSANGQVDTAPLTTDTVNGQELFVSKAGPICKVGKRSVAVGFGTSVKLLIAGNERFDDRDDEMNDVPFASVGHRKKFHVRKSQ